VTAQIALATEIESAVYRSWRARECVEYDGWQLRFADGFSRRGNSVYPAAESTLAHTEKLEWCRRWYAKRGLDLVVRQTVASEPGLDDILATEGFTLEGRTDVMVIDLEATSTETAVSAEPSPQWWRTISDLWGFDLDRPDGWRAIINRIDLPSAFVCIEDAAAGLAIRDGNWLGLFEIVVAPEFRRTGLGTSLTRSLMAWGADGGAERAYLQVVADNHEAIALYKSLGFERAYTYWYRRDQAPANSPT
jgi:GNAT superfamily N-acetyltransferase